MGAVVAPTGSVAGEGSESAQPSTGTKDRGNLCGDPLSEGIGQLWPAARLSNSSMVKAKFIKADGPATAGALDFSGTAKADG